MKLKKAIELSKEKVYIVGLKIFNNIRRSMQKNNVESCSFWVGNRTMHFRKTDQLTDIITSSKEYFNRFKSDIELIHNCNVKKLIGLTEKWDRYLERIIKKKKMIDDEYHKYYPNYNCQHCSAKVTKEQKYCHQCGADPMKPTESDWIYTKYKEPKTSIEEKLKYDYDFTSSEYLKELLRCGNHRAVKFLKQKYEYGSEICGFCALRDTEDGCNNKPPSKKEFCGSAFERFYPNEKFYELLYGDE